MKEIEKTLIEVCMGISERFEINFLEIGNDEDHVHFLIQGVPKMPVSRIVQIDVPTLIQTMNTSNS